MTYPRKGTKAHLELQIQELQSQNARLRQERNDLETKLNAMKEASEPCEKCGHAHKVQECDQCNQLRVLGGRREPAVNFYCKACDDKRADKSDFDEEVRSHELLHELIAKLREPARDADEKRWQKLDIDRIIDQATRVS